jgi:DNA-binding transcriptional LysR family regulator
LRTNNGGALREALLAGLGIGLLPTFIVGADVRTGRLRQVMDRYTGLEGGVYAIYAQGRHLPAKVRAFIDFLADRLGPTAPWDV